MLALAKKDDGSEHAIHYKALLFVTDEKYLNMDNPCRAITNHLDRLAHQHLYMLQSGIYYTGRSPSILFADYLTRKQT